jgi:nucleoside-triphosphatase THEP1
MNGIHILSGEIQSGKTSLCLELVDQARNEGVVIGGLLSPAVFKEGKKVAVDVLDLKSTQRRRLAVSNVDQSSQLTTKRWAFDPTAMEWGNRQLLQAVPCDLLLIDELGPLEFYQDKGWLNGFKVLQEGKFGSALVVIRPSLLAVALRRWKDPRVIDLTESGTSSLSGNTLLNWLLDR